MALAVSIVLLGQDTPLPVAALQNDFQTNWGDESAPTNLHEDDGTVSFSAGTADVVLGRMPVPMPWSDLEGPCATSILWPSAAAELKAHAAHIIVTVAADLNPVEIARQLTIATASVVRACPAALGVYWGSAPLLVPRQLFIDFAEKVLPHGPPLRIWVDFRVGMQGNNFSGGFTSGLVALGCMEIEVEESPEKPSELRERLVELATYVVEKGPVIKDGDSVGRNSNERIRVIFDESTIGRAGPVMRLKYEPQRGPWWKVW